MSVEEMDGGPNILGQTLTGVGCQVVDEDAQQTPWSSAEPAEPPVASQAGFEGVLELALRPMQAGGLLEQLRFVRGDGLLTELNEACYRFFGHRHAPAR